MPKELTDILANTNPWQILFIILSIFVVGKWFYTQGAELITVYKKKQKEYHLSESAKERAQEETENRFKKLEDNQNKDYHRIKDVEAHLFEIQEQNNKQNEMLRELSDTLINLRLETMRGRILDFTPAAIDLTHPQSKERYLEIYKLHTDYLDLIAKTGKQNNFEKYNFELIEKSYQQRTIQHRFTEELYIPGLNDKDKLNKEKIQHDLEEIK